MASNNQLVWLILTINEKLSFNNKRLGPNFNQNANSNVPMQWSEIRTNKIFGQDF
jgi:hypothetical protein